MFKILAIIIIISTNFISCNSQDKSKQNNKEDMSNNESKDYGNFRIKKSESEWKETETKARAVLRAVEMVQGGLHADHD
jgi:hypothetical protein